MNIIFTTLIKMSDFILIDGNQNKEKHTTEKSIFINFNHFKVSSTNTNKALKKQTDNNIKDPSIDQLSLWQNLKRNVNNLKNIVTFNMYERNQKVTQNHKTNDQSKSLLAYIFSKSYDLGNGDERTSNEFIEAFQDIIWFSYRKNFQPISMNNNIFTTDAGWGCTIRATQMFIANAIRKLNKMSFDDFMEKERIYQFLDNPIDITCFRTKEQKLESIKNINLIKGFEDYLIYKQSQQKENITFLYPPFSLRNICKDKNISKKSMGEWFSNTDTMAIINEIHKEFPIKYNDEPIDIYNFFDSRVPLYEILANSFTEIKCECLKFQNVTQKTTLSTEKGFYLVDTETTEISLCNCEKNYFKQDNKFYKLNKKFFLFISVRHGLYTLNDDVEDELLNYLTHPCNVGFVGGKGGRALYFIGKCGRELFFLDPHHVQEAVPPKQLQLGEGRNSYQPRDVYKVNVKEISPNFTIGFVITSEDEFRELVNNYKEKKGDPGFDKLFVINNNQQKEPPINKLDIKYNFFSDK